jgi:hypothetical protein
MHPTLSYHLAQARTADLRHRAQRDTLARTARRARARSARAKAACQVQPARSRPGPPDAGSSGSVALHPVRAGEPR